MSRKYIDCREYPSEFRLQRRDFGRQRGGAARSRRAARRSRATATPTANNSAPNSGAASSRASHPPDANPVAVPASPGLGRGDERAISVSCAGGARPSGCSPCSPARRASPTIRSSPRAASIAPASTFPGCALAHALARRRRARLAKLIPSDLRDQFDRNGFIVLHDVLPDAEFRRLQSAILETEFECARTSARRHHHPPRRRRPRPSPPRAIARHPARQPALARRNGLCRQQPKPAALLHPDHRRRRRRRSARPAIPASRGHVPPFAQGVPVPHRRS